MSREQAGSHRHACASWRQIPQVAILYHPTYQMQLLAIVCSVLALRFAVLPIVDGVVLPLQRRHARLLHGVKLFYLPTLV